MNKSNIYITDNGHFTSVVERYLSDSNTAHSLESVGLTELFKYRGPNDFACRAVLKISNKERFDTYLNFVYTNIETREEYLSQTLHVVH